MPGIIQYDRLKTLDKASSYLTKLADDPFLISHIIFHLSKQPKGPAIWDYHFNYNGRKVDFFQYAIQARDIGSIKNLLVAGWEVSRKKPGFDDCPLIAAAKSDPKLLQLMFLYNGEKGFLEGLPPLLNLVLMTVIKQEDFFMLPVMYALRFSSPIAREKAVDYIIKSKNHESILELKHQNIKYKYDLDVDKLILAKWDVKEIVEFPYCVLSVPLTISLLYIDSHKKKEYYVQQLKTFLEEKSADKILSFAVQYSLQDLIDKLLLVGVSCGVALKEKYVALGKIKADQYILISFIREYTKYSKAQAEGGKYSFTKIIKENIESELLVSKVYKMLYSRDKVSFAEFNKFHLDAQKAKEGSYNPVMGGGGGGPGDVESKDCEEDVKCSGEISDVVD